MEKTDNLITRIAIIGPESTGKSTLTKQLAEHFNDEWIPEYAREYVENLSNPYTYNDVIHIAETQLSQEQESVKKAKKILFLDTDLIITKIWLQVVYGNYPEWIDLEIQKAKRDLYLLCYHDLPWIDDPVRENPHLRNELFEAYKNEVIKNNFTYFVVKGKGDIRLNNAINEINKLL